MPKPTDRWSVSYNTELCLRGQSLNLGRSWGQHATGEKYPGTAEGYTHGSPEGPGRSLCHWRDNPPPPPPSHDVPEPCPSALLKEMGSPSTPRPQTRMMQPHITMIMPQEGIQEGVVGWFWLEYRYWSVLSLWAFNGWHITVTSRIWILELSPTLEISLTLGIFFL